MKEQKLMCSDLILLQREHHTVLSLNVLFMIKDTLFNNVNKICYEKHCTLHLLPRPYLNLYCG